jgi:hypothetical protein
MNALLGLVVVGAICCVFVLKVALPLARKHGLLEELSRAQQDKKDQE